MGQKRIEGQTERTPNGTGTVTRTNGRDVFSIEAGQQSPWIVDFDESAFILPQGMDGARLRATLAHGNIIGSLLSSGSVDLRLTNPTSNNFVRQADRVNQGARNWVTGSSERDVIDATALIADVQVATSPSVIRAYQHYISGGSLGRGNDEVRVSLETRNAYYDLGNDSDTVDISAISASFLQNDRDNRQLQLHETAAGIALYDVTVNADQSVDSEMIGIFRSATYLRHGDYLLPVADIVRGPGESHVEIQMLPNGNLTANGFGVVETATR